MDSTLHSHLAFLYIQGRIAEAERERAAREIRRVRKPRRAWLRLPARRTAPTPARRVGAGSA